MGIISVGLNNITLDHINFDEDDPETMIHVILMAWRNRCKKHEAFEKAFKKLMPVALHPTRWWDWCMPEGEKKGIEPIFTDKS